MDILPRLGSALADLLFPAHCLGCGRGGDYLCPACQDALPWIGPPFCRRCGLPLRRGELCPDCQASPRDIDGIRSLFLMQGLAREAIHKFKYENLRALAWPLGGLLWRYLEANPLPADALVPVPLHPRRLRQRGHNQAALLARELGQRSGLPVVEGMLTKIRHSPAQARASSAAQRRANVEGAFACRDRRLEGRRALLIDDVCTTGATLEACAATLKKAGAASAWGLTLAREA